jgi:hypothetical protein
VDGVTASLNARLVVGGVEYALVIVSAEEHIIRAGYL